MPKNQNLIPWLFFKILKTTTSKFSHFADFCLQFYFNHLEKKKIEQNGVLVLFYNLAFFHRSHLLKPMKEILTKLELNLIKFQNASAELFTLDVVILLTAPIFSQKMILIFSF